MNGNAAHPTRRVVLVDHLARVEGHGGITVEFDDREVTAVRFDVFEGIRLIEELVKGRRWDDIAPIVSRICAICSVAHTLTSLQVTERVFEVGVDAGSDVLRDLLWRGENIESHALHLFLLAAPDYLGHPSAPEMAAADPDAVRLGLRLKRLGNRIQEVVGGRAIHPVNAIPGGFATVPSRQSLVSLRAEAEAARADVQAALAWVRGLPAQPILDTDTDFVALRPDGGYGYGRGSSVGILRQGTRTDLSVDDFTEAVVERAVPHSHAKHTFLDGRPFMVGALARLALNGDLLPEVGVEALEVVELDLPSRDPLDNNKAQAVELAVDVERTLELLDTLLSGGTRGESAAPLHPRAGGAAVLTEAPRGALLHMYDYDDEGILAAADVVTPTAFNAASLEHHLRAEVDRQGLGDEPFLRHRLEMIARAYDPCISCSVHLLRRA